ncbi:hypothetical protein HGRIS_012906 [Hohenbuehelia grisea]|uniref:Cytidyltransferase-like domain-containing protein n=1 Tax=Hohenbuehelia grisea TaxID=104357 RepID=A0ABR3ITX9_9AGAR
MSTQYQHARAIVLATLPDLTTPHYLGRIISTAAQATRHRLLIILVSPLFDPNAISHTDNWDSVQRILTYIYVQATKVAQDMDKVLMEVDVLLKGPSESLPDNITDGVEVVYSLQGDTLPSNLPANIASLEFVYLEASVQDAPLPTFQPSASRVLQPLYPTVALGGTFDHLHAGHKILLSMAAWITSRRIIVGVTDDALLKSKSNKDLLEPLKTRIARVRDFLALFRPGLVYDVVSIDDVYGPTKWDADIQALVVSKETLAGGTAIASHRSTHGLPALETFVIDVISHSEPSLDHEDAELLKQTKLSSTFIREWIARHRNEEEKDEK